MTREGDSLRAYLCEAPFALAVALVLAAAAGQATAPRLDAGPDDAAQEQMCEPPVWTEGLMAVVVAAGAGFWAVGVARLWRRRPLAPQGEALPAPWSWWDVVKLAATVQALVIAQAAMVAAFTGGPPGRERLASANLAAWAATLLIGLAVVRGRGATLAAAGFARRRLGCLALAGAAWGLAFWPLNLAIVAAQAWALGRLGLRLEEQYVVRQILMAQEAPTLAIMVAHAVIVAPLAEEFLFRALLIPLLERRMRPGFAIALSAALFTAVHGSAHAALPIMALGLFLGFLYQRTRTLAAPVACHLTFNLVSMTIILAARPTPV
ncbi:MAG TPA: CPBP family intramembrane metalloprotease [Candidatus Brocadiia bacterium]|nr:CPBP family intramembrane metalloprotease [Candidatus Brocadiia bacterium]